MEAGKRIGPNFVYIIGLCGLLAGAVSTFLLQYPSDIHTADLAQEWSEWSVLQQDNICVMIRRANCSKDHCNNSEFKYCKEIAQWNEWAPSECTITNNACFISRIRSCSVPSLKTCDSDETNSDIKYWGDMTTCPCRNESTESTPDSLQGTPDESSWLEWNAWECHDNIGCLMVRRRSCQNKNRCAGDSYQLETCKVDRCDQFFTWNSWGEWNCHTETKPCVRYKHRNCSSGHDADCELIGGFNWDMKSCDGSCTDSTTPSLQLTTYYTKVPAMTMHMSSDMTPTSSLSTAPTTNSVTVPTSVLTTMQTSTDGEKATIALPTTISLPTTTEYVPIYWLEWSGWKCSNQSVCLMTHSRNCSRQDPNDCKRRLDGDSVESVRCELSVCPATWSEWGNWTCRMGDHGTCNMTRTRICSTGAAKDCGTVSKMTKPCDQNLCPDKIRLQTSGQCRDYVSVGPSCSDTHACYIITDTFHPICTVQDMASKNCPKACGCCDEEPQWSDWSAWECNVDTSSGECKMTRKRNCSSEDQCEGISNIVTECDDKICSGLPSYWLGWSDWGCSLAPNHTCKMTRTRPCSNSSIDDCAGSSVITRNCLDTICPDIIQLSRRVDCSAFDTQNTKCKDYPGCGETNVISNLVCLEPFGISECPVLCGCCDPTSSTNNTAVINGTLTNNTTTNNSAGSGVFTSAAPSTRWTAVYNYTSTTSNSTLDNSNSVDVNLSSVTVPTTHNDSASVTTGTSTIDYSTSSSNVTANGNGTDSNNTVTSNSSDLSSTDNPTSKDISTYPTNASSSYGGENTSANPQATSSSGNVSAIITTESTLSSESTTSVNLTSNSTNGNNITSTNNATSGTVNNTNNTSGNTTNGTINSGTNTTSLTVTTDSVLTTESTTKTTTTTTTVSSNNQPVTCKVCAGPEFLCEKLTMDKQCDYPNNYCINKLSNHKDGTRTVIKSCGNYDTCYRDWFLGSSDSDKCRKFDDNNMITLNFACTYCCTKDLCNDHIRPPASTLFKAV